MKKKLTAGWILSIIFGELLLCFGIGCFFAWILMLLFNWVVPIFWASAPGLTFWQSFGLWVLINLVFPKRIVSCAKSVYNKHSEK